MDGAIICFDLSLGNSIKNAIMWIKDVNARCPKNIIKILVGTKSDLPCKVQQKEINKLCLKYNLTYIETSSKTGDGCVEVFDIIINKLMSNFPLEISKDTLEITKSFSYRCCH